MILLLKLAFKPLNNCLFIEHYFRGLNRTIWDNVMIKSAKELQKELRSLLTEIGWSPKDLAREVANSEENRRNDNDDPDKEYEKLRKALNRPSTKPTTLQHYINFVVEHNKNRKLYRIPEISGKTFSENELMILKSVREIANEVFQNEQTYYK